MQVPPAAIAPFTDADVKRISALPAAQQIEEVRKELIRRNVEREVIEIRSGRFEGLDALCDDIGGVRSERVGESVFLYSTDARALLNDLENRPQISYLHRPADLEDVFLRLTGRELRE